MRFGRPMDVDGSIKIYCTFFSQGCFYSAGLKAETQLRFKGEKTKWMSKTRFRRRCTLSDYVLRGSVAAIYNCCSSPRKLFPPRVDCPRRFRRWVFNKNRREQKKKTDCILLTRTTYWDALRFSPKKRRQCKSNSILSSLQLIII